MKSVEKQASIIRLFITITPAHAVLAHLLDQRGATNTQALGGTRHDAIGVVQRLLNQALLQTTEVVLEVQAFRRQHRVGGEVRRMTVDRHALSRSLRRLSTICSSSSST